MNVLLDDLVDDIFHQVQGSLVPRIEAVTKKATQELKNRLQTPPSSVDLLYLTDRLIVSSQPTASSNPSYIDNGREKRPTYAQLPRPISGPQTRNPITSHNDNDISRRDSDPQESSSTTPSATENHSGRALKASTNEIRGGIMNLYEGETSTGEKSTPNQYSLDSPVADTKNTHRNSNGDKVSASTMSNEEAIHDSNKASSSRVPVTAQNSPGIMTSFLDKRHGSDHYLAFSLVDEQPDDRTLLLFRRQIVQLGWWSPCVERSETPSIPNILKTCYAIHAYLKLHHQNVALVYCSNGKTRTAIVVACYLKFAGIVKYSQEGFFRFLFKRGVKNPETTWKQLPPTLRLFFRQFDTALNIGGYLNRKPLLLRAIALQGVPVEDKPCLDIWDSSQRLVYSSHPEIWASDSTSPRNSSALSQWIDEEGFYKVDVCLDGDFLLLCRFGGDFAKDTAMHDPSKILFRYSNNTGFLAGGCPYELPSKKVDLTKRYALHLDHEDFLVTLLFQADWDETEGSKPETTHRLPRGLGDKLKSKEGVLSEKVWCSHHRQAYEEGLKVIFQHHSARPDASDIKAFRTLHDERVFENCAGHLICLALQLTNFSHNRTNNLLLSSPLFAWWRLPSDGDTSTESPFISSNFQHDKVKVPKNEEMDLEKDGDRLQKMFGVLNSIDVSKNLDSKDIASFKELDERRKLHETNSDSGNTPKRRNSAIRRWEQSRKEVCCHDVGWMVSGMTYPRPGDIVRCFGAEYAELNNRFPTPTLESICLPKVPFHPDLNPIFYRGRSCTRSNSQQNHYSRRYDRQRGISTQVLLQMQHTGVTLPCLLDLLRESQKWDGLPPKAAANMEKEGTDEVGNKSKESTEGSMNCKSKEQKEKEWKEARNAEELEKSRNKDQRSQDAGEQSPSQAEETTISLTPWNDDPEYAKYFKMLKMGITSAQVEHAMKRDGKDPLVLKLNPEKSLEEQMPEQPDNDAGDVALKEDPEYEKYFKMLKMGLPRDAVKNALQRDGKDPSVIDLDPTKSLGSQLLKHSEGKNPPLKDDPDYQKYFKMLKIGMPVGAVKNALVRDGKDPAIIDLDPGETFKSQTGAKEDTGIALKDDPAYTKYFKMIGMGLPIDAVKNALMRDGKDPDVMDLDPGKSIQFQLVKNRKKDTAIPLKDDPEYAKYFKMIGMGLPIGAVKNALERDGKDPDVLDLDPEKSVAYQLKEASTSRKSPTKKKKRVRRKKIYWNPIDPGKLKENSMWHIVRDVVDMNKLNYDQKEFEELFTESADPKDAKKMKKPEKAVKKLVQVIDPKRSMNGGIILARLKIEYGKIADIVNKMERSKFDSTQLSALKEFLANPDERRDLIGYMQNSKSPKEVLYANLSETEKYMYKMIDVPGASEKIDAMLFRCVFKNRFDDVNAGINTLNSACDQLRSSEKLRKLMAMILTVVNEINTGGEGNMAIGFTLDALLKLNEAKAFDKKTSVLHYVVKLVKKNDSGLLTFSNDISSVIPAESVLLDSLANEVKALGQELVGVHNTVQAEAERLEEAGELKPMTLEDLKEQRTTVRQVGNISQFNKMDHHTGRTPMERFMVDSKFSCDQAIVSIEDVRKKFLAILQYFGEDENMPTGDFFGILRRFMREFQKAVDQVEAIEKKETKERKRAAARVAKAAAKDADKSRGRAKKGQHGSSSALQPKPKGKKVLNIPKERDIGGTTTRGNLQTIKSTRHSKQQTRSDLLLAMAAAAASRKGRQFSGVQPSATAQAKKINSNVNTEKMVGGVETGGLDENVLGNQETCPAPSTAPLQPADQSESSIDVLHMQKTESKKEEMNRSISSKATKTSLPLDTNMITPATRGIGQKNCDKNKTSPSVDLQKCRPAKQREDFVDIKNDLHPLTNSNPVPNHSVTVANTAESGCGKSLTTVFDNGKIGIEKTKPQNGMEKGAQEHQKATEPQTEGQLPTNRSNSVHQGEPSLLNTKGMQNTIEFSMGKPSDGTEQKRQAGPHPVPVPSQRKPQTTENVMKEASEDITRAILDPSTQPQANEAAGHDEKTTETIMLMHTIETLDSRHSQGPIALQAGSVESFSEPRTQGSKVLNIKLDKERSAVDPTYQPETSLLMEKKTSSQSLFGTNDPKPMKEQTRSTSAVESVLSAPLSLQLIEAKKRTESFYDISVVDSIPQEGMEVGMSQTWTDGEDITNWMPWAGEVIKACDSDSVVGFEMPRDLNDGAEFDDDSTIASSTSFASYYDDISVGSGLNTPGKMAPPHHPTTPFDPYFDNVEQPPNQFMIHTRGRPATSMLFDDSQPPTVNLSQPPFQRFDSAKLPGGTSTPRDDVGLKPGLSFGADVGFDDGLGGFGAISNIDNNNEDGRDISKAGTESKRKNAWFPWGGGSGGN
ncbi:unnamed protein product [Cylindrotheca closterium]|uniref:Uncharacterized protein n=1 Tax=Cylindrotheca closterium TaxID=2856 RepID=A0AAD2JH02_9STRA|nr:unnamed protein product [Cylindrotheca closterium]